jgi:hypothetical protein
LSGGTFTVTNTGSRGALFDTPIINQPQVAILGTGAVVKRPIVVTDATGQDVIAIRSMVYLSLSYDHRLVDGADAARFLGTMKDRLEGAAFEAELEVLAARLKQALKELPNDREIPGLLSDIDGLARKSGLEVRKFQPMPEVMHEYYAEVPVQIIMDGSYHEFGIFFDRVSKMGRIVSEKDIEIGNPVDNGTETDLTVSGKTVTYRFLTDEEVAKAKAEAEGKNRRPPPPAGGGGE